MKANIVGFPFCCISLCLSLLMFTVGCDTKGNRSTEGATIPRPVVNYFANAERCRVPHDQLKFCKELVEIPMGHKGAVLRIPRNYLDEWYVYPSHPERNYALVYVSWPGLTGRAPQQLPLSVQDSVKIVFRGISDVERYRDTSMTWSSYYRAKPREDVPAFGLRSYGKGHYLESLESITTPSGAIFGLDCAIGSACAPPSLPTCGCSSSYRTGEDFSVKFEFHKSKLPEWKKIYSETRLMVEAFTGN